MLVVAYLHDLSSRIKEQLIALELPGDLDSLMVITARIDKWLTEPLIMKDSDRDNQIGQTN